MPFIIPVKGSKSTEHRLTDSKMGPNAKRKAKLSVLHVFVCCL